MVLLGLILIGCSAAQQPTDRLQIDENQPYLEFKLTYNYDVYKKPSIFLPKSQPTFAIWLEEKGASGYSGANGQPSLIWRAELDFTASSGQEINPEIIGHGNLWGKDHKIYTDLSHVTTARDTFLYVGIRYVEGN